MSKFKNINKKGLLTTLIFSAFFLILLSPLWLLKVEPKWDAVDFFYPAFSYLADSIREGRFPLWDPFTNSGYPYHADPQCNTLNPLAIALGLLVSSTSLGFVLFWVLNWLWGGLGMLYLARCYGTSSLGSLTTAISYTMSGYFIGHAQHTSYILVGAWLPWIFAFADKAILRSNLGYALFAGASIGLCSYGGYPAMVFFLCLALAVWLFLRNSQALKVDDPHSFPQRYLWVLITLAIITLLLILIWSPMLNAFLVEGKGYTNRISPLDPRHANYSAPFSFVAAISLFFPYASIVGNGWMGADISMTNGYMGILTIPLAVLWFVKGNKNRRPWWLLVFTIIMFWISLGGEYGLRTLLYHIYPPMQYTRFSAPFRLFWILPFVLAGGMGISHLIRHSEDRSTFLKILLVWSLIIGSTAVAFTILSPLNKVDWASIFHRLYAPAFLILPLALFLVCFLSKNRGCRNMQHIPLLLTILIFADLSLHLYNNNFTVWNKVNLTEDIEKYHRRSNTVSLPLKARYTDRPFAYFNAQQILKVPLVQGYSTMKDTGFNKTLVNSPFLEVLGSPIRYWLSPGVDLITSKKEALSILSKAGPNTPVPVFVENSGELTLSKRSIPGEFGTVMVRSYKPETIELSVYVPGSKPVFLASTERYAAGWKVHVDGTQADTYRSNLYFRGAIMPPGQHDVVWTYSPKNWKILVFLSYSSLLISFIVGIYLTRRKSKYKNDGGNKVA